MYARVCIFMPNEIMHGGNNVNDSYSESNVNDNAMDKRSAKKADTIVRREVEETKEKIRERGN